MTADFQKVMGCKLSSLKKYYFFDGFATVSRSLKTEDIKDFCACIKIQDEDNVWNNLTKCHFSKEEINWRRFLMFKIAVLPLISKTKTILFLKTTKIFNQTRSFMRYVQHVTQFVPNRVKFFFPFKSLLKKLALNFNGKTLIT